MRDRTYFNKAAKRHYNKVKNDVDLYKTYLEKQKGKSKRYRQRHCFSTLAYHANKRYGDRGIVTSFDVWILVKRQRCICELTGRRLSNGNLSLDHIIPYSKGGMNTLENLRVVERMVNISKHNMSDEEFFSMCHDVCERNRLTNSGTVVR